jgi:hypothetical protein
VDRAFYEGETGASYLAVVRNQQMDQRIWWQPGEAVSVRGLRSGDDGVCSPMEQSRLDLLLSGRLSVRQQDNAW